MKDQGIQTSVHYPPIHQFEDFSKSGMSATRLPVTEEVALREVTLPLYPNLDSADIELIVDEVHAALGNPKRNSLAQ
jgi:dTDP-4-amino-4,6-dideoxygalactose transaminase